MPGVDPSLLARLHLAHTRELAGAYARLAEAHGFDAVVLHSGRPKKRSSFDDQHFALRPTPHFQHWAPLCEADCFVVVEGGKTPVLVWPSGLDFWERPRPPESTHFLASFSVLRPVKAEDAPALRPRGRVAFVGEDAEVASWFGEAQINPVGLLRDLDALRVTKSPYEIVCLDEANRVASIGHEAVRRAFFSGDASELELHLAFLGATRQDDPDTPYKNIVAKGENSAILHHIGYRRERSHEESLLLDAGAAFQGYCSDITRTWIKGTNAAASTFLGVVQAFEDMQKDLCTRAMAGLRYEELHDESHRRVSRILADAKLVRLSPDEICERGISRLFYPHGLGHSLGLQCHDVGCAVEKPRADNPFLRNTSVIAEGQTFTIEPGLYFIDQKMQALRESPYAGSVDFTLLDALSRLGGVRIEDDLVAQAPGVPPQNLTRAYLPVGGGGEEAS